MAKCSGNHGGTAVSRTRIHGPIPRPVQSTGECCAICLSPCSISCFSAVTSLHLSRHLSPREDGRGHPASASPLDNTRLIIPVRLQILYIYIKAPSLFTAHPLLHSPNQPARRKKQT